MRSAEPERAIPILYAIIEELVAWRRLGDIVQVPVQADGLWPSYCARSAHTRLHASDSRSRRGGAIRTSMW